MQSDARDRLVSATLTALKEDGFAAATSRAVAARAGVNQALVFYYFGSMDALLLAAVDATNEERLAAYRSALADARTLGDVIEVATRLYREDRESGHVDVVSQMIAGSVARPDLAPPMLERMQPWLRLSEEVVERVLAGSPLESAVPVQEAAYAIVTFYLGANLLTHLDPDRERTDALVARLAQLEPLLSPFLSGA